MGSNPSYELFPNWGVSPCQISLRSVQWFGFLYQIYANVRTHTHIHIDFYILDFWLATQKLEVKILFLFHFQIIPGGAAAKTGRLRMGDRILSVNGVDIRGASHQVSMLQNFFSLLPTIRINKLKWFKQEVNGIVILPPVVFPGNAI